MIDPAALSALRDSPVLPEWDEFWPPEAAAAARLRTHAALDALIALGPGAGEAEGRPILGEWLESFDRLYDDHGLDITTIDRDLIAELFFELAEVVGVADAEDFFDEHRGDW